MSVTYDDGSKNVNGRIGENGETPLSVDPNAAGRFLALLDADADSFVFASFDDDDTRVKGKGLIKPAHKRGDLNAALKWMAERQAAGASVCYTVQAMQGVKRRKSEIQYFRAVFAELDRGAGVTWPLEPSIVYETSPGRSHVLFFIDPETPITAADFTGIQQRIVETYGGDPGAWDAARALRLPGTWNLKNGKGRTPHLVTIKRSSGARYARRDLVAAFPAPVYEAPRTTGEVPAELAEYQDALDGLPADCPRREWLSVGFGLHHETDGTAEGFFLWDRWSAKSKEKYTPGECLYYWRHMKSGSRGITGKSIFWLARQYGWKPSKRRAVTARPHTADGKATNTGKVVKASPPAAGAPPSNWTAQGERPSILMEGGELHDIADRAERYLVAAKVSIFARGNTICRPFMAVLIDARGRSTETAALTDVNPIYMRTALTEHINWLQPKGKELARVDAPPKVCNAVLTRQGRWHFPPLAGVISAPTLRYDGSLLSNDGYDETTKLYLKSTVTLPAMPDTPNMGDATKALATLNDLLTEFPFVDDASRSVGLSAIITPTVRAIMDVAPGHVVRAPTAGTGKSYLFDVAASISLGTRCPVIAACKNDEELEKRLGAAALMGQQIINFDNVNGDLRSDALSQLVSQSICQIRVLGRSEMPSVSNRFCLFASGNNIRVAGDLTRRVLLASMDARIERPSERHFQGSPVEKVLADRGKYIAASLTIVRAYFAAGRPPVASIPFNGFQAWSDSVRSALLWLGCADPISTISQARDEDPELQQLVAFIEAMKLSFGTGRERAATTADIIMRADIVDITAPMDGSKTLKHQALHDALTLFYRSGRVDSRSFGKWLSGVKGRIVDGHCLKSEQDKKRKVARWFVDRT